MMSPAVTDITETAFNSTFLAPWVGTLEADRAWRWIDNFLLLVSLEGFFVEGEVWFKDAHKDVLCLTVLLNHVQQIEFQIWTGQHPTTRLGFLHPPLSCLVK